MSVTLAVALPFWAEILVVPILTPVAVPAASMVAIVVSEDDQVIARPASTLPAESFAVAVSCVES